MRRIKKSLIGILLFGILVTFYVLHSSPFISAQGTVCAVNSSQGWCQDVDSSQADSTLSHLSNFLF